MNADCKGALSAINNSYKAFIHNNQPLTKNQVKEILEYAISKGYKHTGQLKDEEINKIINKQTHGRLNDTPL